MDRTNEVKNKCLCGGVTTYHGGTLGYEAMICERCGFHWNAASKVRHEAQIEEYKRIVKANQGSTPEVLALIEAAKACHAFLIKPEVQDWLNRSGAFTTTYGRTVIDTAAALAPFAESSPEPLTAEKQVPLRFEVWMRDTENADCESRVAAFANQIQATDYHRMHAENDPAIEWFVVELSTAPVE
jgi:hypothetical protein